MSETHHTQPKDNPNEKEQSKNISTELPITQNNHKVDTVKNQYNHKEVHVSTSSALPPLLQIIKEYIGLFMKVWGCLTTVYTMFIFLAIWNYLSNIGLTDLYLQSIVSVNTIALIVITATILALIIIVIISPSFYAIFLTTIPYKDKKPPLALIYPYLISPLCFLMIFVTLLIKINSVFWVSTIALISTIFVNLIIFFIRYKKIPSIYSIIYGSLNSEKKGADLFGIGLSLFILCWISLFPLIILNDLWNNQINDFSSSAIFVVCIWLGYIPGAVFIYLSHKKTQPHKTTVYIILTISIVTALAMAIFPIKIRTTIFKSVGIYQDNEQMFLLLNTDLKEAVAEKFFINNSKTKIAQEDYDEQLLKFQKTNYFTAYNTYSLGNVIFLCKEPFNPDRIKKEDKKSILDTCFAFTESEVRHIYQTIPKYDHLNFDLSDYQKQWLQNFKETTSMSPLVSNKFKNFKEMAGYNTEQWKNFSEEIYSKITKDIPYDN